MWSRAFYRCRALPVLALVLWPLSAWASEEVELRIRDGIGFAGGAASITVNMEAEDTRPTAIAFWIEFDHSKLTFLEAEPGLVLALADKELTWGTPAPGRVSFLIYGVNDIPISPGKLMTITFEIHPQAEEGEDYLVHGFNQSATDADAVALDTEIEDGEIEILQCFEPAAPSNFTASDGVFSDHVQLSWIPVFGAQSYVVYRSATNNPETATIIAVTTLPFHSDFTASAAARISGGGGCSGGGQSVDYSRYYYWVLAQNICGESPLTPAETGYRGVAKSAETSLADIEVFPPAIDETATELAVRIDSEYPVDSASLEVAAVGPVGISSARWEALDEQSGRVWLSLEAPLSAGETLDVTVTGRTLSGAKLDPHQKTISCLPLAVEQVLTTDPAAQHRLSALDPASVPDFLESVGPAYRLQIDGPIPAGEIVALPVPDGVEPAEVIPYLYIDGKGWFAAHLVPEWTNPDSIAVSGASVVFQPRYGGVVRLGYAQRDLQTANFANLGSVAPLGAALLALLLATQRRR